MKETRKFTKEKETKHMTVFTEQPGAGKPPIVGTIYVQKWFAGDAKEITVTVETPEAAS